MSAKQAGKVCRRLLPSLLVAASRGLTHSLGEPKAVQVDDVEVQPPERGAVVEEQHQPVGRRDRVRAGAGTVVAIVTVVATAGVQLAYSGLDVLQTRRAVPSVRLRSRVSQ